MLNIRLSALTLLLVVFNRRTSGGHLLDLPSGLLGGLERPQLMLLLVDPGGVEASVVLRQTGGSRGCHGCRQVIPVRLNNSRTVWKVTTRLNLAQSLWPNTLTPHSPSGASCWGEAASVEFLFGLSVSAMLTSHTIVAGEEVRESKH